MDKLQKFYFQAVDSDNRRISGSIFAENEQIAREKIKKQGLALFNIEKYDESKAKTKDGLMRFEFRGTNPDGKPVRGHIEAINAYEAFKKLKRDYDFFLTSVVDTNLNYEEKAKQIAKGIPDEWLRLYEEESFAFKKKKKKKKVETVEISEKDQKELEFYSHEIGIMSKEIRELLDKSSDYIERSKKEEILQRLGLLERLKQSNAVDHLKNLTHKLIDQISDDKLFIEELLVSEADKTKIEELKGEFKEYSTEKKKSLAQKALELNLAFNVDPRQLVVEVSKIRPITQLGLTAYWTIVSLFLLMTVLWIKNGLQIVLNQGNLTESLFIFQSLFLWLITAISFVNMMIFAPMVFSKKYFPIKIRLIYFGIALIANVAVILFLPAFF